MNLWYIAWGFVSVILLALVCAAVFIFRKAILGPKHRLYEQVSPEWQGMSAVLGVGKRCKLVPGAVVNQVLLHKRFTSLYRAFQIWPDLFEVEFDEPALADFKSRHPQVINRLWSGSKTAFLPIEQAVAIFLFLKEEGLAEPLAEIDKILLVRKKVKKKDGVVVV